MVLAPTVGQSLGLAGVASGSCIGLAFNFSSHIGLDSILDYLWFMEEKPKLLG
jgi:hypothetical protein